MFSIDINFELSTSANSNNKLHFIGLLVIVIKYVKLINKNLIQSTNI